LSHALLGDARLYVAQLEFDHDLRDERQAAGCACGGTLHVADYPRKPRGGPARLPEGYERRLSLCCGQQGCRKRSTPPSLRYLGRRVYLAAVVVLASAMRHGLSARRVAELRTLIGVSRRTLERWRRWWLEQFRETPVWKTLQGRLASPVDLERLPRSLLERFAGEPQEQLVALLRQLSPLSVTSAERGHRARRMRLEMDPQRTPAAAAERPK
jgi:hypothetical protein